MLSIGWEILIIILGILAMLGKCCEGYYLNKYLIKCSKKEKENILQTEDSNKNILQYESFEVQQII